MNMDIRIAKELVRIARSLVAKDWTREIKSKLPDLDDETVKSINALLQGYHDMKKEKMVAYWLLDKKTIEYPFSRKLNDAIDSACKKTIESQMIDNEYHRIDYKKYDSPYELVKENCHALNKPDDWYEQEKQWLEKCPELIDLFIHNTINMNIKWKEEKEIARLYMTADKSTLEQLSESNIDDILKMFNRVNEMDGISLEDFSDMKEMQDIIRLIDMNANYMDLSSPVANAGTAFIERMLQNDPASVNELLKYLINTQKRPGLMRLIVKCDKTPESMLIYIINTYNHGVYMYDDVILDVINNKNITLETLKKLYKKYKALKKSPQSKSLHIYLSPYIFNSILANDKFTDTSVIDEMINEKENEFYLDASANTVLKKYAYEKYGNVKISVSCGASCTVAKYIASILNYKDIALLPMCDDPDVNVRYALTQGYDGRLPIEFYLKLINDPEIKVAIEAVHSCSDHCNESFVMAIASNERLEIRKMLLSEYSIQRQKELFEKALIEMLSHETPLNIKSYIIERLRITPAILDLLSHDKSSSIRAEVAGSYQASASMLERLSHDPEWNVVKEVLLNFNTPGSTIERLLSDKSNLDRLSVHDISTISCKSNLSPECLTIMYEHAIKSDTGFPDLNYNKDLESVLYLISGKPNTPADIMEKIFDEYNRRFGNPELTEGYKSIPEHFAENKHVPLELLAKIELTWISDNDEWHKLLSKKRDGFDFEKYYSIISEMDPAYQEKKDEENAKKSSDHKILREIAGRNPAMAKYIAMNTGAPVDLLETYAKKADLKQYVAMNTSATVQILDMLANDSNEEIRYYVACNKSTDRSTLERLSQDPSRIVSRKAKEMLKE